MRSFNARLRFYSLFFNVNGVEIILIDEGFELLIGGGDIDSSVGEVIKDGFVFFYGERLETSGV